MSRSTKQDLLDAAVRLTARAGARGLTARAIGAEAGVNQALIFYHFESVENLLRLAYADATDAMVRDYAEALGSAETFADLYAVGERLGERSRADGSAALLTHVMAAAHHDDLAAPRVCGLASYIERPLEFGAGQPKDVSPRPENSLHVRDIVALAERLGC